MNNSHETLLAGPPVEVIPEPISLDKIPMQIDEKVSGSTETLANVADPWYSKILEFILKHKKIIAVVTFVIILLIILIVVKRPELPDVKNSPNCDNSKPYLQQCLQNWWEAAGCTTKLNPIGPDNYWNTISADKVKEDMKYYAIDQDPKHVSWCHVAAP